MHCILEIVRGLEKCDGESMASQVIKGDLHKKLHEYVDCSTISPPLVILLGLHITAVLGEKYYEPWDKLADSILMYLHLIFTCRLPSRLIKLGKGGQQIYEEKSHPYFGEVVVGEVLNV